MEDKIEILFLVGEKYKTFRETADIFNSWHPEKNIYHAIGRKVLNKVKLLEMSSNK